MPKVGTLLARPASQLVMNTVLFYLTFWNINDKIYGEKDSSYDEAMVEFNKQKIARNVKWVELLVVHNDSGFARIGFYAKPENTELLDELEKEIRKKLFNYPKQN